MRFDWYQATIPDDARTVTATLAEALPRCSETRATAKGGNGYLQGVSFLDDRGGELGRMMFGGNAHPNFRATSHHAPDAARTIRRIWPRHRVTRLDVAADYGGAGAFNRLHAVCRRVADRNRLKTGLMFQPDLLERGHTYRIGSPASPVMVRLYEKGLDEGRRGREADPDWSRLELQVRPQKAAKDTFAHVTESEAWGASKWTAQLHEEVLGDEPPRLDVNPRPPSEWERTQAALVQQYGRHALDGGYRAAGHDAGLSATVDAYIEILRRDLLAHVRGE